MSAFSAILTSSRKDQTEKIVSKMAENKNNIQSTNSHMQIHSMYSCIQKVAYPVLKLRLVRVDSHMFLWTSKRLG